MKTLEDVKNFIFSAEDSVLDKWIREKFLDGHNTITEKAIAETKDILSNTFTITITTVIDILAIGVVGYMLYNIIRYMFLSKSEDGQKVMFAYFGLMMFRILNTILKFQFRM